MTSWEQDMLFVLANQVRMLALSQLARTWWSGQRQAMRQARTSARSLENKGWVKIRRVLSRPVLPLTRPLFNSTSDSRRPDFKRLAKTLRRRARTDVTLTQIVVATAKTRELFGNGSVRGGRFKLTQMTHDLHVSEVFLVYRGSELGFHGWLSEDDLPQNWPLRQRPDALLVDCQGEPLRAVEYGGDYSFERLESLHNAFVSIALPYEIW